MNKFRYCALFLFSLLLLGCAQVTSLNLKKHQFGRVPKQIVWIQVAGLRPEHLALLKFDKLERNAKTAFEDATCIGNTWEYNLFDLRPTPSRSFLSQLTGRSNFKNSCEDYKNKPIWEYLKSQNYETGILANQNSSKALTEAKSCKKDYFNGAYVWLMDKVKDDKDKLFHVDEVGQFKDGSMYYDKSCLQENCYSSFYKNAKGLYQRFTKNAANYLYIIKDHNYHKELMANNLKGVEKSLEELNKIFAYFQKIAQSNSNFLVLVSSASGVDVDFPKKGKEWRDYVKNSKIYTSKRTKLLSSLYATGARAENFCGIYSQREILSRMFSGAKEQGLEFSIINPFDSN